MIYSVRGRINDTRLLGCVSGNKGAAWAMRTQHCLQYSGRNVLPRAVSESKPETVVEMEEAEDHESVQLESTGPQKTEEQDKEEPLSKKRRICLSLKKPRKGASSGSRFASPTKAPAVAKAAKGVVPENTVQCTKWAVNTFLSWAKQRNEMMPQELRI